MLTSATSMVVVVVVAMVVLAAHARARAGARVGAAHARVATTACMNSINIMQGHLISEKECAVKQAAE